MEHAPEEAPLAANSRAGSDQALIQPPVTTGTSNSRALKIAGLTALACLLVASQIFTAYLVFDQKQQIQGLQANSRKIESRMAQRSQMTPQKMAMPISSLPLLDFSDDSKPAAKAAPPPPPKKQEDVAPPTVEKQLQQLMEDFKDPNFDKSFLANLQSLKQQSNESDWKSFESWLRYWLIFQMAQKSPSSTPPPPAVEN